MKAMGLLSLGVLLGLGSCTSQPKGDARETAKAQPLSQWQGHTLTLEEGAGSGTFEMSTGENRDPPMALKGYFTGLAGGTEVVLDGASNAATAGAPLRTETDLSSRAGPLRLREVTRGKLDLKVALTITLPGHRPLETTLPPFEVGPSVAALLGRADEGIVRFAEEPAHQGAPRSVAVLGPPSAKRAMRILGPAEQVWDIDWVAIERPLPELREKPCGGYNRRIDVVLKMHDSTYEVHDRRLGNVVRRKTFQAPSGCPREPLLSPDGSTHAYPKPDEVDGWLRGELGLK